MWRLVILPSALKELAALPAKTRHRVDRRIQTLAQDPRVIGSKALRGQLQGLMRLRVGHYRVIYRVDDHARAVTVIQIVHRRDAY